jgi:hypothetical protein
MRYLEDDFQSHFLEDGPGIENLIEKVWFLDGSNEKRSVKRSERE